MSETEKPMSAAAEPGDSESRTKREALDWLRRLTSGEVTRADLDALDRWRAESPTHRRALAEANLLWDVLGKVAHEADARGLARNGSVRSFLGRPATRRAALAGAAAASVAYLMMRPPLHLWPTAAELMASYRTATGERRQLSIASGITIEMNTQTSLSAAKAVGELYSLDLVSGQLAVSVRAQAARSVVITAANGKTQADRGSFDVRRDGSSVCVTCADGVVRVSYRSTTTTLQQGQQVSYDDRGLGSVVAADSTAVTAWQRGLLIFRDAPLAEVIEEVNRYRPGRILLLNDALAERRVIGGFRLDQIDDVVNYIGQAFGAKIRSLPGGVVLLS
jgi:transmembrane sensor